jgi:hypothetical protein
MSDVNYQLVITELEARAAACLDCVAKIRACFGPFLAVTVPPAVTKVQAVTKAKPAKVAGPKPVAPVPTPPIVRPLRQSVSGKQKDVKVLALIAARHGLTATEIAPETGDSVPTIYARLQRLVHEGQLTVGADKKYRRAIAEN